MKQSTRNDLVVKLLKMQIKDRQIEKLSRQSVIHYYIQFPIETFYFQCELAEFRTPLKLRVQASFQPVDEKNLSQSRLFERTIHRSAVDKR
jgi:hypothetical protein